MIAIHVQGRRPRGGLPPPALVRRAVTAALRAERFRLPADLNVIFVDRAAIRRLNRNFLEEKGDTDVIAFPYDRPRNAPDIPFGDIYVCAPVAMENARRFGEAPRRELVRLVVHGLLHLLGHDDHVSAKRARMWKRQEAVMDRVLPRRTGHPEARRLRRRISFP